jgi:hypothetical protein
LTPFLYLVLFGFAVFMAIVAYAQFQTWRK